MKPSLRLYSLLAVLSLLVGLAPARAGAQWVTTAAISGRVTNQQGQGVANARVGVANTATGAASGVTTPSLDTARTAAHVIARRSSPRIMTPSA